MSKSFMCKRTPQGTAVVADSLRQVRQRINRAEKHHGPNSSEVLRTCLILAAMYCGIEDYEKAEPLLKRCLEAAKQKPALNQREMLWAASLLGEAYFKLGRIPEALLVTAEAKPFSRGIDLSANDPLLEAFLELAQSIGADGDFEGRLHGFSAALMTLCWCVTHGLHRSRIDAPLVERLRVLFESYGIGDEQWEWMVKHAHLTRYDFVGLVSILLHHTGLVPAQLASGIPRKPRFIEVR